MDGLDEKQNGAPAMEVDDIVSVKDRKYFDSDYSFRSPIYYYHFQKMRLLLQSICRTLDMM